MGYYAKPEKQAQRVISWGLALGTGRRNDKNPAHIHSISTANAYRSALTTFCRWIQKKQLGNLIQANVKICSTFLEERAGQVGQKTLDRDRQAIQYLLTRTTRMEIRLPRIKSTYSGGRQLAKQSRAYTRDQVQFICANIVSDDQHSRHVSLMLQVCGGMSSIPSNVVRSADLAHTANGRTIGLSVERVSSIR